MLLIFHKCVYEGTAIIPDIIHLIWKRLLVPDFLDFKATFVYAWFDKWLQTRQAERCGLFGPLHSGLHRKGLRSDPWRTFNLLVWQQWSLHAICTSHALWPRLCKYDSKKAY